MRRIFRAVITLSLFSAAAVISPQKSSAQTCTRVEPQNLVAQPGQTVSFDITLDSAPATATDFTRAWGTDLATASSKCFTAAAADPSPTVTSDPIPNAGTYRAWIFGGCQTSPTGTPQCGPVSFQVGTTSGDSPMTPPDERSTFICKGDSECEECILSGNWWTVLGCLPIGQGGVAQVLIGLISGIAGGVAFLMMVRGAFLLITSGGDINQVNSGKSSMAKGAAGLLIVVFATVILRIVAGDILRLPGF